MTTRVVRFHSVGEPEVLKVEQVPIPTPSKNQVRVKVQAIGLNRAESMFRRGQYLEAPILPSGIGYEAAGVVDAVGEGVTRVKVGDVVSVVTTSMLTTPTNVEIGVFPEDIVIKHPSNITPEEASAAWIAYLTAYFALVDISKLAKDQYILITAASSSAALGAIQIAKVLGAKVIATTRTEAKKQQILSAGADHVIVTNTEDLEKRVLEITGGKGTNVVYDPVGGPQLQTLAKITANHGYLLEYGLLSTEPTPFPIFALFGRIGVSVQVYKIFDYVGSPSLHIPPNEEAVQRARTFINTHLQDGSLKPIIAKVFQGIDSIVEAHKYLESNVQFGKVVVKF